MKIQASVSTHTSLAQGSAPPLTFQPTSYEALFFGKRAARRVDPRKYRHLTKGKRKLQYLTDEVADLIGGFGSDVTITLAEGRNASISRDGELRVGVELLEEKQDDDDFLVALVGHELGHQPWHWPTGPVNLSPQQLNALYRAEERRADDAMGRVVAMLGAKPDSMAAFLLNAASFEKAPPLDYDPAEARVALLKQAYSTQMTRDARRRAVAGTVQSRPLR